MRGPCPEGGHNPCRRVEDALSTSPQGTGPIPDAPEVAGLAPPAALTFAGRLGHCGATVRRSPGAAVPACFL